MIKLLRLSLVPFALLCVLILRLLKGRVRIGMLWTQRIGHLAGNVEVYLCERDAGIRKSIDIWCAPGNPCNKQLLKMWRRVLTIDRTGFFEIVWKVNKLFDGHESTEIHNGNLDRDVNNLYEQYPPHLKFTPEEEARGQAELRRMGIPKGAKWVCLIVRDSAYLPELSYHSYRDSDINDYGPAAMELAKRGYYVIRMGAKVNKSWARFHSMVINYATITGMRSDFMDIYLAAKCEFAISSGTGLDAICSISRRPICFVNYVPIEYLNTWNKNSLAIWKHHEKDGKRMTLEEIYESKAGQFMRSDEYEQAGITLVDNTPEEIKTVVEEMADKVSGLVVDNDPLTYLSRSQHRFWKSFPRSISPYTKNILHGAIRLRIGHEFLKGYSDGYGEMPPSRDSIPVYFTKKGDI